MTIRTSAQLRAAAIAADATPREIFEWCVRLFDRPPSPETIRRVIVGDYDALGSNLEMIHNALAAIEETRKPLPPKRGSRNVKARR